MPKADSHNIMNPSPRRAGASIAAPQSHSGALKALARLREETIRQVTKLTGKGYRQTADCDADAAVQSSGLPRRSRRQVMVLMSSAAVLAFQTKQAVGASPPAPNMAADDTGRLQALIDEYNEKKAILQELERREEELEELELPMIPDPPPALCRRKADVRLFAETQGLRSTEVKIGEPYSYDELMVFRKYPMMRTRGIPIKRDEKGKWVDFAVGEEPSGEKCRDYDFRWIRERWPLAQKRADAIAAAEEQYHDDCEALRQRLGFPELVDAIVEAAEALRQIQDEIDDFEMRSMADAKLKARFIVDHLYEDEMMKSSANDLARSMLRQLAGRSTKDAPPEQAESGATCDA